MTLAPRVIVVHRRSEYDTLRDRHGTHGQAEFFLRGRGRDPRAAQAAHESLVEALGAVRRSVPPGWRSGSVERADLARFRFAPEDVIVVVGPSGLVANVAKYLQGQPVVGVDPGPDRAGAGAGPLVPFGPDAVARLLPRVAAGTAAVSVRCLVRATSDDGQVLTALNDVYLGHPGHQSARYRLRLPDGAAERQSSSGIVVGTGTGATGWCASLARERVAAPALPGPGEDGLAWFVREAWPSPSTGTAFTAGRLDGGQALGVVSETDPLVVFGDGMEADRLVLGWGQEVLVDRAPGSLRLVV